MILLLKKDSFMVRTMAAAVYATSCKLPFPRVYGALKYYVTCIVYVQVYVGRKVVKYVSLTGR